MPRIFEKDGFRFFFYSNEHAPIHVHVTHGGGEAVFLIGDTVELRDAAGLKPRDLRRARALAETHKQLIVATWHEWFD